MYGSEMHLQFALDDRREFPKVTDPGAIRSLRVWNCKFRTLAAIGEFSALEGLEILVYPDESLDLLTRCTRLRYLSITHLPRVTDLQPLSILGSIVTLRLATLPSWDASGKKTVVRSLEPLSGLRRLKHVELFGVVPEDRSLAPLEGVGSLETGRFSKYPRREVARFSESTSVADDHAPPPDFG